MDSGCHPSEVFVIVQAGSLQSQVLGLGSENWASGSDVSSYSDG